MLLAAGGGDADLVLVIVLRGTVQVDGNRWHKENIQKEKKKRGFAEPILLSPATRFQPC
jgi:hypothetical protein